MSETIPAEPQAPTRGRRAVVRTPVENATDAELNDGIDPTRSPAQAIPPKETSEAKEDKSDPPPITEWKEPNFSEKPEEPVDDGWNEHDELLGKVYVRKDNPTSKKRYEPLTGFWANSGESRVWILEVYVFVYTDAKLKDGSRGRRSLARRKVGNEGSSLQQPAQFCIPAATFKLLYEREGD